MVITQLKFPWRDRHLCLLIRFNKFRSTPEVRHIAKTVTYANVYGFPWRRMA